VGDRERRVILGAAPELNHRRMHHGGDQCKQEPRTHRANNLLEARRVLEPIDCGGNDDTAATAASHTACGMFLVANHMVLWHDNLVAGAKVEDTVNGRSFVAASDATTTDRNQILWRCAVGFDPAP
jgi:hypothetical protein